MAEALESYDKQEDIPEALRGFYAESGGKWYPNAKGMVRRADADAERERIQGELETLRESMAGGLSAADAAEKEREIARLQERLREGTDGEKLDKLMEKRLVEVDLGDGKKIKVLRTDSPILEGVREAMATATGELQEQLNGALESLTEQKIKGGALTAANVLGSFRPEAIDDIVEHCEARFKLDKNHEPVLPETDPEVIGDQEGIVAAVDKKTGKPVTFKSYLEAIAADGSKPHWMKNPGSPIRKDAKRYQPPSETAPAGETRSAMDKIASGVDAIGGP